MQFTVREKLPRESLASMEPVRYKSSDGLEIPAYLTLPKGVPAKESAYRDLPPWRAVGTRHLGLQRLWRSSSPTAVMQC